ncbi:hypothetical protein [Treponema ruminis]|uniref:Major outer membrane protein n=1 Tax=Treponema ruminis TaxID=744515 RepID=A0A7W8LL34_9SPIR|nr:hypothetical protein [Treponema ruminis]MBB5224930.1 hypothetical protein [Treponema ruminis]
MKKIVSAVALAAAAASLVTAEVKITMNGRLRPTVYGQQTVEGDAKGKTDTKAVTKNWMSLDGYAAFEDTLKFAFNNEDKTAGLTFSVNVKNGNDTTNTSKIAKKSVDGTNPEKDIQLTESNNKLGNFLTLNQYDIWSTVFGTDLKLGAGSWKDGNADGAYRVKKDVDAGNSEGVDFERFKLGSAFKNAPSLFVDDIVNFNGGSNALAAYAEYPIALNDDMSLKLTAVAIKAGYWSGTDDDTTTSHNAGFAGRAQFNVADLFNSELIVKKPVAGITTFAFYAMPTLLPQLTATIGGSYTMDSTSAETWNGAWDFDLRARYQVTPELSITTFNKIAGLKESDDETKNKAEAVVNAGIAGLDGKAGQLVAGKDITMVMWNNISARYKVNDFVTATVNVGLMNVLGTAGKSDSDYGINYRVTPGAQLYLSKPATLWVGFSYSGAKYNAGTKDAKDFTVSSISIPAILRVKL